MDEGIDTSGERGSRPTVSRRSILAAGAAGVTAAAGLAAPSFAAEPPAWACAVDPVEARAMDELGVFVDWVREFGVRGVIGEIGWPAGDKWQALGRRWLGAARTGGVPSYLWGASEWWPATSALAFYHSSPGQPGVSAAGPQAADVEAALREGHPLAVALVDGTFGADLGKNAGYSSANPGNFGWHYLYPGAATMHHLAGRGYRRVRMPIMWERLQSRPGDSLVNEEVEHVRASLRAAADAGLEVVLGLHNYCRYAGVRDGHREVWVLGTSELPTGRLADFWARIAGALGGEPALVAYEIMNEPHDLPGDAWTWEGCSRLVVDAIRRVDRRRDIHVDGYAWSAIRSWREWHPRPWIDDDKIVYSGHEYFDVTHSGFYPETYEQTAARLAEFCNRPEGVAGATREGAAGITARG